MGACRKLIVLVCIAAMFWVALHPASFGLASILAPVLLLIARLAVILRLGRPQRPQIFVGPALLVHSSRAP